MDKEKQIFGIAKILCGMKNGCDGCMWNKVHCNERNYAEEIYNAGYRKSEDVAREIFEEIEKTLKECLWFLENHPSNYPSMDRTKINVYKDNLQYIAELKNKHTEEK